MRIETLKYFIQSANINFLYGSGLSRPYLAVLGNIEKWLTELNDKQQIEGKKLEYTIVEASILKQYFETVMLRNYNPSGGDYDATISEYKKFLSLWNGLINKRSSRLVGKQVNLFTTNVDVMLERAALRQGIELNDGFQGSIEQLYDTANFQKTVSKTSLHFQNVSEIPAFNLIKIHGLINWRNDGDIIKNDIGLSTVNAVESTIGRIGAANFVSMFKTVSGKVQEKTMDEMISEAKGLRGVTKDTYKEFLVEYGKMVMINPTKRKFKESVIDHHFYELMRQYSNNLEKENTLLFVMGFSFADEHIADITRRAAKTNPTLHIVVFAYDDNAGKSIETNLIIPSLCLNNNIDIVTPSAFKTQNSDNTDKKIQEFAGNIKYFDFRTVNDLFKLISDNIVVYGK